jgi:hypothetical protein
LDFDFVTSAATRRTPSSIIVSGFDAWLARLDAERRARSADYLRAGP